MSVEKTEIETFFGRCRCCLSYGYLKNMWEEHHYKNEPEIYGEMLVQCFALTWDQSEEAMEQDQICEQCITRLRDANDFKKVVLESQEELLLQIEAENMETVKEESLAEEYLKQYKGHDSEAETEYTMDTADAAASVKDETEYEEIEYLEDEEAGGSRGMRDGLESDSSLLSEPKRPPKRQKQPRQPDTDDEDGPKRKWPKKLPKAERQKTYKQYSEGDLRKCLEEVRNNVISATEAATKYNIPKKTICAKIKMEPKDVRTDILDSTNKATLKSVRRSKIEATIVSHEDTDTDNDEEPDTNTQTQEEINTGTDKQAKPDTDTETQEEVDTDSGKQEDLDKSTEKQDQLDSDTEKKDQQESEIDSHEPSNSIKEKGIENRYEMLKHKNNLKMILKYSTATLIKGQTKASYSCWFCDNVFSPEKLKKHNYKHGDLYADAIKVKYVSDLIMKLDITGLRCTLCNDRIDILEELTEHLQEAHNKTIHTDIKNYFIPFTFDTVELRCAICYSKFKYFKTLSEHMCEHYSNYKCPECNRAFINKLSMQLHTYRHRKGEFKCPKCPKVFDTHLKVRDHHYVTHRLFNKKRKCTYCDERFPSSDMVKNHESKVHGAERFNPSCETCNKTFASDNTLKTHKKRHHLYMRPFECETCFTRVYSRQELDRHTVTHIKAKNFRCNECGNRFGTKQSLYRHLLAHQDVNKYECDICNMSFNHVIDLNNHVLLKHTRKRNAKHLVK